MTENLEYKNYNPVYYTFFTAVYAVVLVGMVILISTLFTKYSSAVTERNQTVPKLDASINY